MASKNSNGIRKEKASDFLNFLSPFDAPQVDAGQHAPNTAKPPRNGSRQPPPLPRDAR
jgi:hypothetical protein